MMTSLVQRTASPVLDHVSKRNRSAVMLSMDADGCKDANQAWAASPLSPGTLSIGQSVERHGGYGASSRGSMSVLGPKHEYENGNCHKRSKMENAKEVGGSFVRGNWKERLSALRSE